MEAIVLAGGFGRRLAHVVNDVPKPMADINGRPFLEYTLRYLKDQKVTKVVLAVSFKKEIIIDYFKNEYKGMKITYSVEDTPLGTGGGIKKALKSTIDDNVFVVNGDTFFNVDMIGMREQHIESNADVTLASKLMYDFDRYGTLEIKDKKIISFIEKQPKESGYISGGIYLIKRSSLDLVKEDEFSIEKDFFENKSLNLNIYTYKSGGYFIDIGIPEDYFKAQEDFEEGNISR